MLTQAASSLLTRNNKVDILKKGILFQHVITDSYKIKTSVSLQAARGARDRKHADVMTYSKPGVRWKQVFNTVTADQTLQEVWGGHSVCSFHGFGYKRKKVTSAINTR